MSGTVKLISSNKDDKKREKEEESSATQPGSAFTRTGPSAPSGTQQARAEQAAGPTRGTGFTGVGRFLQANVGSRLGQEVAGRVSRAGQEAASRLGQSVGEFKERLGTKPQEPGQQGTGLYGQFSQQQQAAKSALEQIASGQLTNVSPEQQAAYRQIAAGNLGISGQLQDIEGVYSQANLAGKLARGTQTTKGRIGLLRQVVGGGSKQYTTGQSDLDALILGQAGGQLAAARRSSAGLERQVGTQERLAEEQARQFGAEAKQAGKELGSEAAGLEKTTLASILGRKEQYEKELGGLYDDIQKEIKAGSLSKKNADVLKNLGLDPSSQFYGLSLTEIANLISRVPGGDITMASSATQQEAARLNALRQLAGTMSGFSAEELQKVGTTIDPLTGLSVSGDVPEVLKTQKEKYETLFGGLAPGYAGYGGYAWDHPILKDPSLAPDQYKGVQAVSFSPDGVGSPSIEDFYGGSNMSKAEMNMTKLFMGSGSRGNYTVNYDLMRDFASGKLYDQKTGVLNVGLARRLRNFWANRVQYKGKDGLFGAGIYKPFEGDAARVRALDDLIKKSEKTFQIKE